MNWQIFLDLAGDLIRIRNISAGFSESRWAFTPKGKLSYAI